MQFDGSGRLVSLTQPTFKKKKNHLRNFYFTFLMNAGSLPIWIWVIVSCILENFKLKFDLRVL